MQLETKRLAILAALALSSLTCGPLSGVQEAKEKVPATVPPVASAATSDAPQPAATEPEEASGPDETSATPAVMPESANGTMYYVGQAGCSDAGPGDEQAPFCSFAVALSHLAPGDTLIIKNGVYTDQLAVDGLSGTLDAPIVIRGESRDGVILDGGCPNFPCSVNDVNWEQNWEGMVKVTNSDHLTISDLTARNDIGFGIMVNGGISMTIKNTLIDGMGNGGLIVQSDPVTPQVIENEVRRTNLGWRDESGSLYDGDHEAISIIRASDFVVANNYVHDVFEEGIDVKESSTHGEVRDNFVERACSVGIYINEADDVRVYRNQVRRSGYYLAAGNQEQLCSDYPDLGSLYGRYFGDAILLAVGDLGDLSQGRLSGVQVYQNVVWDAHGNGLQFWDQLKDSGTGAGTMTGNRVYNNVFYNTLLGGIRLDDVEDTVVVNNIVALNEEEGITGNATTSNTVSHNLFYFKYDWQQPVGTAYVIGDPLFVDPVSGDFHLQESSPAIDSGLDVGLPYAGSAPDIGAYEYGLPSASGCRPPACQRQRAGWM